MPATLIKECSILPGNFLCSFGHFPKSEAGTCCHHISYIHLSSGKCFCFCYFWRSFIFPVIITLKQSCIFRGRGISSSGRAPASHAGGTGIDTRILQLFFGII